MSTQQGARLYRDGQFEGRRVRIPVFLGRAPDEPPDREVAAFCARLLQAVAASDLQRGDWRLCDCDGWPDNASFRSLVAWCWSAGTSRHLVVVNLSGAPAQARVQLPWDDLAGRTWELTDRLDGQVFERAGDALEREGLYVALEGWQSHFLAVA